MLIKERLSGEIMDLDNINDVEVLRKAAKRGRAQLRKDVNAIRGKYTFKKGFWYLVEQDEYGVYIFSEDYIYEARFTYIEAGEYLNRCY